MKRLIDRFQQQQNCADKDTINYNVKEKDEVIRDN